ADGGHRAVAGPERVRGRLLLRRRRRHARAARTDHERAAGVHHVAARRGAGRALQGAGGGHGRRGRREHRVADAERRLGRPGNPDGRRRGAELGRALVIVEALSPTAERIFDSLPPYYQGDPTLSRITQAVANELDRLQAYLQAVASGLVPKLSDDTLSMLGIWENILKLPVEPAGVSVEQRQQALQAAFTARQCRTTAEWVNAMNIALG